MGIASPVPEDICTSFGSFFVLVAGFIFVNSFTLAVGKTYIWDPTPFRNALVLLRSHAKFAWAPDEHGSTFLNLASSLGIIRMVGGTSWRSIAGGKSNDHVIQRVQRFLPTRLGTTSCPNSRLGPFIWRAELQL